MAAKKKDVPAKASSEYRSKLAQAAILKNTGLKPLGEDNGPQPFVPSGSFIIDDMIGGTPTGNGKGPPICPGYPRKRISEVYGPEASGKTTAALHAIVSVQKAGGVAMFLDFEHALNHNYAKKIGVKFDNNKTFMYYQPNTLEDGFKLIYIGIKAGIDLIVVDSVASMVPKAELLKKLDAASAIGAQAREFSRQLPKVGIWLSEPPEHAPTGTALVLINQTRSMISSSGKGDTDNTSGGKALKFYAYLRLKFTRIATETVERKDKFTGKARKYPFGNRTQVKVVKSKIDAKQGHCADIFIRYGMGIDDYYSTIESAVASKVVVRDGAMYKLGEAKIKGKDAFRTYLIENPKTFASLQKSVLDALRAADTIPDEDLEEDDEIGSVDAAMEEAADDDMSDSGEEVTLDTEEVVMEEAAADA